MGTIWMHINMFKVSRLCSEFCRTLPIKIDSFTGLICLCLTRPGNYRIHEFDWLKSILKAV